ncbi:DUF4870 domain-containing protein [Riemerella columbina]|uniref:DUF4870 domain-containing protein n=1 Tax=Riemerella columbina TaxID=103810 RepID=UPI0026703FFB|nr:DUF4870 domain-containing protein [Riemerella columbina]WKS95448.1 DUF4870 domain-containing protein [Riemerella columbina]
MQTLSKQEDRNILFLMHLSQLLSLISGIGGFVVPLIIWLMKKDQIKGVDEQGKEILNFQITMFIALLVSSVLCLVFIGMILLPIVGLIMIIVPIIQAFNAKEGRPVRYPFTIRFLS